MNVKNGNNPRSTYFNVFEKKISSVFFSFIFHKKVRFSNLLMEKKLKFLSIFRVLFKITELK